MTQYSTGSRDCHPVLIVETRNAWKQGRSAFMVLHSLRLNYTTNPLAGTRKPLLNTPESAFQSVFFASAKVSVGGGRW